MPHVLPSDLVRYIDEMFPFVRKHPERGHEFHLDISQMGKLGALMALVDDVPNHLIVVEGDVYAGFLAAKAAIKESMPGWQAGNRHYFLSTLPGFGNTHVVGLVRRAMVECPDEVPSPSTLDLPFIADDNLRSALRLDISAANGAFANGEWKAATVLAGSVVEALLLTTLQGRAAAAAKALVAAGIKPNGPPERWGLHEYIEAAAGLQFISETTRDQARIAKEFRNFIHPGKAQRLKEACNRRTALSALAAVEAVVGDLISRLGPKRP